MAVTDNEMQTGRQGEATIGAAVVMDLLAEHVPLTLLADLAVAEPESEAILRSEGLPEDAWWVEDGNSGADAADRPAAGDSGRSDASGDPGTGDRHVATDHDAAGSRPSM